MIFITGYTKNTEYERLAESLRKDLAQFGISLTAYEIKNTGVWWKNCLQKSHIIKQAFSGGQEVCWLDADATVKRAPTLFYELIDSGYDMAVRYPSGGELLSGTLAFYQTDVSEAIIDEWCNTCDDALMYNVADERTVWDQVLLRQVVDSHKPNIYCLPTEYVKIKPKKKELEGDYIIGHRQQSRNVRANGGKII